MGLVTNLSAWVRGAVPRSELDARPDPSRRHVALLLVSALVLASPTAAQEGAPSAIDLDGNWVRTQSNNPINNGMRIRVEAGDATLTAMPESGSDAFSVGEVLWRGLSDAGKLEVLGSNGRYYSASLIMEGDDRLHIDVDDAPGPGYEQTWERAGPSIDGDWVLAEADDPAREGLRIRVQGDHAAIRFLPREAPRSLRVGDFLWRDIGAGGQSREGRLEALSDDRTYATARFRLPDEHRLRLDLDADGGSQLWVRPGVAVQPESEGAACLATSLRQDGMDVPWGWGLTAPAVTSEYTVRELSNLPMPRSLRERYRLLSVLPRSAGVSRQDGIVVDVDPSTVDGLDDHLSYVWRGNAGGRRWRNERYASAQELEERIAHHESEGFRPVDVERFSRGTGVRYAAVWIRNPEEVDWHVDFDLTSGEYGELFRESRAEGYRLVDVEAYRTPNGVRYAGIWHRSCDDANWRQVRGMDRESYLNRVDSLAGLGFSVVDFESYRTGGGQRYAAIWEQVPSRAWRVRTGRRLRQFLDYHHRYRDMGFRLIDYESYETPNGVRYAGIWAENDPRFRYEARAAIDDSVRAYRTANDLPGISIVIIQDGDVVYRRGFGDADREAGKEAHAETVYLTASISKVIGATLAAKLEEEGVGGLDLTASTSQYLTRAADYIPDDEGTLAHRCQLRSPPSWLCEDLPALHTHTVQQLLAKTACVQHYREGPEPDDSKHYLWRAQALAQIWNTSLLNNCTPGQSYRYSTHGFTYVGAVLEAVTGRGIATLIDEELARPFELPSMRAMFTADGARGLPANYHRAKPYRLNDGSQSPNPQTNPSEPATYENSSWKVLGGGIESNAVDLARFGWKLLNGEIVSDTVRDGRLWTSLTGSASSWVDQSTRPPSTPSTLPSGGVGMAWNLGGTAGSGNGRSVRHGGSATGAGSYLKIWRDEDLVIAMLSNRRDHDNRSRNGFLDALAGVVLSSTPP